MTGGITSHRPQFVFLHGYTTPFPGVGIWKRLFAAAGAPDVEVHAPTAPGGVGRRDPFNPTGRPSWFRYSTDLSRLVPPRFDRPDFGDVAECMYERNGTKAGGSLWEVLERAVSAAGGAAHVTLAGESQGGTMAALVGFEWNRVNPRQQLGTIGLIRTAVDPQTWQPRPQGSPVVDDPLWAVPPPRYRTRFHVVLGDDDATFRPWFSLASLGPLLDANPLGENVEVTVLPGVGHADHDRLVYRTYVGRLLRQWPRPLG